MIGLLESYILRMVPCRRRDRSMCVCNIRVNQCGICFENRVWNAVFVGDHSKLGMERDKRTQPLLGLTFARPDQDRYVKSVLRNCLQCLLYTSALGKTKVTLDNGLQVDLTQGRDNPEASNTLYWALVARGPAAVPGEPLTKLVLGLKNRQVVRSILHCLIADPEMDPTLSNGVPLIHILLTVGSRYEQPDKSVDLFHLYQEKHPDQVDQLCPLTGMTTLQVAEESEHCDEFQVAQVRRQVLRKGSLCGGDSPLPDQRPQVWIPTDQAVPVEGGWEGMKRLDDKLTKWADSEEEFRQELRESVLPPYNREDTSTESRVITAVMDWLRERLNNKSEHTQYKLKLSGSVGEGTKILPMDEVDLILQVKLEADLEVTDKYSNDSWISSQGGTWVHRELTKVSCKQPFPHLAKVVLGRSYPGLGKPGEELSPERFCLYMEDMIREAVEESPLPPEVRVPEGKSLVEESGQVEECRRVLERTKSGLVLNLEYLLDGRWQEMSVDLVSVLVLGKDYHEHIYRVMPDKDSEKRNRLIKMDLFSSSDGIIVKNNKWRLSYSGGEKKVVALYKELFQALKYLNKVSEKHINIQTYFLKEIFCSFITSPGAASLIDPPAKREPLATTLCRLIRYAEVTDISTPFYCTTLGSQLECECRRLFKPVRKNFGDIFQQLEEEARAKHLFAGPSRSRSPSQSSSSAPSQATSIERLSVIGVLEDWREYTTK